MDAGQVLLGRYELSGRLGHGGMSVVWLAHDRVLGRDVAVKVLASTERRDEVPRDRILAEAKAVAQVVHPHVTNVFDYGEVVDASGESVAFVVMELLRGRSLAALAMGHRVTPQLAIVLCAQIAGALAAAHAQGLVHRDIKPGNVMVTGSGAKVFDFGIALPTGATDGNGRNDRIMGTASYLAPERITGATVSPASDVYSLGVLLYRLLVNDLPWSATTTTEILAAHVFSEPADLPSVDRVPADVGRLYRECVAKNPAKRPAARQVAIRLAAVAGMTPPLGDAVIDGAIPTMAADWVAELQTALLATPSNPSNPSYRASSADPPEPVPDLVPVSKAVSTGRESPLWSNRRRMLVSVGGGGFAALVVVFVAILGASAGSGEAESLVPRAAGLSSRTPSTPPRALPTPLASWPTDERATTSGPGTEPANGSVPSAVSTSSAEPVNTSVTENPPPSEQDFTSAGGTVTASCDGASAYLASWQAAPGFRVKSAHQGPAAEVSTTFKEKSTEITMTVTCRSGSPSLTTSTK